VTITVPVAVVRVFTDEDGQHGNALGVVLNARRLDSELGPRLTAHLGFSETVFVDAISDEAADVRIFNPTAEMKVAGHPLVGTSRLLADSTGTHPAVLRPRLAAPVTTWREAETTWIRVNTADAPDFEFIQLDSAEQVEALQVPPPETQSHAQYWAWIDEPAGLLRARTFVSALGIPEDEATGSAALRQAQRFGRAVTIRQGRGSLLHARPAQEAGWSEVGGRVVAEPVRIVEL
jgi:predicted PhzF superfamily epimerase YddE/YHI9